MNIAGLIFLFVCHFLSGSGLIALLKQPVTQGLHTVCLSFIVGVPVVSLGPCLLQLLSVPITDVSVLSATGVITGACGIPLLKGRLRLFRRPELKLPQISELPFMLTVLFFAIISVWRCFYMPPYSRDMLSGPELVAEYTVREHTLINSVYNVDLSTSNNYFKSPFVTSLQVVYKLLVYPFGQLWLSVLFVSFSLWLYSLIRGMVHPFIAGLLMFLFFIIPELYAYTFVILYDYSNMVFFFAGFYFLTRYVASGRNMELWFSTLLLGMATYVRTESLILIGMLVPLIVYKTYADRLSLRQLALRILIFLGLPASCYFLCIHVFVRLFVPIPFSVNEQINPDLANVGYLLQRLGHIVTPLIFSATGREYYGWFVYVFCGVLAADVLWVRKLSRQSVLMLYGIFVVYLGLGIVGYVFPLADLGNTTKRGLFKMFPIMLVYMAGSGCMQYLSAALEKWITREATRNKNVAE